MKWQAIYWKEIFAYQIPDNDLCPEYIKNSQSSTIRKQPNKKLSKRYEQTLTPQSPPPKKYHTNWALARMQSIWWECRLYTLENRHFLIRLNMFLLYSSALPSLGTYPSKWKLSSYKNLSENVYSNFTCN